MIGSYAFMGFELNPIYINSINSVFLLAFALVSLAVLPYIYTLTRDFKYMSGAVAFVLVSMGTVAAGDFFTLLVFWELMMLISCLLVIYGGGRKRMESGFRYLFIHVSAGASLLIGVIVQYVVSGSMELITPVSQAIPFFVIAAGIKSAMIPFYLWVVDAYSRTSFATTVLLGAFTTKVGVYFVARILGDVIPIAYMGGAMAVFGVIMALAQTNLRRLLSYHIISQVGYMLAGVAAGNVAGTDAGILHAANHIMYKSLLFMAAGAVWHQVGAEYIKKLGGLARRVPAAFVCGLVGALSISGVPPFNGFVSKSLLHTAVSDLPMLSTLLLIAGVGTVMSFSKFIWYTFLNFDQSAVPEVESRNNTPLALKIPMIYLSLICFLWGVFYQPITRILPGSAAVTIYQSSNIFKGLAMLVAGLALFVLLRRAIELFGDWSSLNPEDLLSNAVDRFIYAIRSAILTLGEDGTNLLVVAVSVLGIIILFI